MQFHYKYMWALAFPLSIQTCPLLKWNLRPLLKWNLRSSCACMYRVGQNPIYTVCIRCFWQGNYEIYGQIWCIYTVLANPMYVPLHMCPRNIYMALAYPASFFCPLLKWNLWPFLSFIFMALAYPASFNCPLLKCNLWPPLSCASL